MVKKKSEKSTHREFYETGGHGSSKVVRPCWKNTEPLPQIGGDLTDMTAEVRMGTFTENWTTADGVSGKLGTILIRSVYFLVSKLYSV